jgi:hypothetical protein
MIQFQHNKLPQTNGLCGRGGRQTRGWARSQGSFEARGGSPLPPKPLGNGCVAHRLGTYTLRYSVRRKEPPLRLVGTADRNSDGPYAGVVTRALKARWPLALLPSVPRLPCVYAARESPDVCMGARHLLSSFKPAAILGASDSALAKAKICQSLSCDPNTDRSGKHAFMPPNSCRMVDMQAYTVSPNRHGSSSKSSSSVPNMRHVKRCL